MLLGRTKNKNKEERGNFLGLLGFKKAKETRGEEIRGCLVRSNGMQLEFLDVKSHSFVFSKHFNGIEFYP